MYIATRKFPIFPFIILLFVSEPTYEAIISKSYIMLTVFGVIMIYTFLELYKRLLKKNRIEISNSTMTIYRTLFTNIIKVAEITHIHILQNSRSFLTIQHSEIDKNIRVRVDGYYDKDLNDIANKINEQRMIQGLKPIEINIHNGVRYENISNYITVVVLQFILLSILTLTGYNANMELPNTIIVISLTLFILCFLGILVYRSDEGKKKVIDIVMIIASIADVVLLFIHFISIYL